ncbi:hypothetical protein ACFC06_13150 [Nocardia sp. NPDC056064]|uniref:hypothetical protein n=1 Tax=Nocardia sp. NPDC056064 TaxID=3345701 RepID=UPI0035DD9756
MAQQPPHPTDAHRHHPIPDPPPPGPQPTTDRQQRTPEADWHQQAPLPAAQPTGAAWPQQAPPADHPHPTPPAPQPFAGSHQPPPHTNWHQPPLEPPPAKRSTARLVYWLAPLVALVVAVAAGLTAFFLTRPDPPVMAVGDCVTTSDQPVELDCGALGATYRIVAREAIQWPVESACLKHAEATRAVAEPSAPGTSATIALCLQPTRENTIDPGGLLAGDCVDVKKAGEYIERFPCGDRRAALDVIAIELHIKIPVTDNACKAHPETRGAYAQTSLGGRALVVCTKANSFATSAFAGQVGDCYTDEAQAKVPCDNDSARFRVLSARTQYVDPGQYACGGLRNATSSTVTRTERTDLIVVLCFGPANQRNLGYAKPGDCVTGFGGTTMPELIACDTPGADGTITSVYDESDIPCSPGEARMTRKQSVGDGSTVCLGPL